MSAMTDHQLGMVEALCNNDISRAKSFAMCALNEDTTKKNEHRISRCKAWLKDAEDYNIIQLPHGMDHLVEIENPESSFNSDRYYLRDLEADVYRHVRLMRKVADELAERGLDYMNSTLLHGVSGTGKTSLARFIAKEMHLPLMYLNFSRLIDSLLGSTGRNVGDVFQIAQMQPCVLFLDEIDTIAMNREGRGDGASSELNRVTVVLMQQMDKLNSKHIVLAATNRLDMLDSALIRRFNRVCEVTPYDQQDGERMAERFLASCGYSMDEYTGEKCWKESFECVPSTISKTLTEWVAAQVYEKVEAQECLD